MLIWIILHRKKGLLTDCTLQEKGIQETALIWLSLYAPVFVPTFDTKVTENLCSGWVFFLQTIFDFLTSHF